MPDNILALYHGVTQNSTLEAFVLTLADLQVGFGCFESAWYNGILWGLKVSKSLSCSVYVERHFDLKK